MESATSLTGKRPKNSVGVEARLRYGFMLGVGESRYLRTAIGCSAQPITYTIFLEVQSNSRLNSPLSHLYCCTYVGRALRLSFSNLGERVFHSRQSIHPLFRCKNRDRTAGPINRLGPVWDHCAGHILRCVYYIPCTLGFSVVPIFVLRGRGGDCLTLPTLTLFLP